MTKGSRVTKGRRECLPPSPSTGGWGAAPDPSLAARPASCRGMHAHCSKVGSSPGEPEWAQCHKQTEPPLPLPGWLGAGPRSPPHTCTDQPPVGPSPLLLFRLPNYQAEVFVWFALFLYVKYSHSLISHAQHWLGHGSSPLNANPPYPYVIGNR